MQKKQQTRQEPSAVKSTRGKTAVRDLAPSAKQAKDVRAGANNLNLSKTNVN